MKIEEVTMTPALAAKLMQDIGPERNLSQARVAAIAADLAVGRWLEDGSPIRIGRSGQLLDGQHRLSAIIRAKVDVSWPVKTGQKSWLAPSSGLYVCAERLRE